MRVKLVMVLVLAIVFVPLIILASSLVASASSGAAFTADTLMKMVTPTIGGIFTLLMFRFKNGLDIFKTEIKNKFDNLNETFKGTVVKVSEGVDNIKATYNILQQDVSDLKNSIGEIKLYETAKKEFEKQLLMITEDWIDLFSDYKNLKEFALLKANRFDEYVLWIREFDFSHSCEDINFSVIREKGIMISEMLRIEGEKCLGKEVMDIYYRNHAPRVEDWLDNLEDIINGNVNNKKHGFQIACLQFKRHFMSDLWKAYNKVTFKKNQE